MVVVHRRCSEACGNFPDQGQTRVSCVARQILYYCATRDAPKHSSLLSRALRPETVVWMRHFLHSPVQEATRGSTEILVPLVWMTQERLQGVDLSSGRLGMGQRGGTRKGWVPGPAAATLCPVQGCWPRMGALSSDWLLGGSACCLWASGSPWGMRHLRPGWEGALGHTGFRRHPLSRP